MRSLFVLLLLWLCLAPIPAAENDVPLPTGAEVETELQDWEPKWYSPKDGAWKRVDLEEIPESTTSSSSSSSSGGGSSSTWSMPAFGAQFIAYLILAGIVIGLIIFLFNLYSDRLPKAKTVASKPKPSVAPVSLLALPEDWDEDQDPKTELRRALERGEWRRAIIWSHVSLIELLEQRGLIALYPGMSDRDCLDQLRSKSESSARLGLEGLEQTTRLLRRALYAQEPANEESARTAHHQFTALAESLSRAQHMKRRAEA